MSGNEQEFSIDYAQLKDTKAATFKQNKEDGLCSETFDIEANINTDTHVGGLKDTDEIKALQDKGMSFDEARLQLTRQRMIQNGIDPATGLPMDEKAVYNKPMHKVKIYRDCNMVYGRVGNLRGDGYLGKVKSLEEAIDLAMAVPTVRGFVFHSPRTRDEWAGRVYGWTELRMLIGDRMNPASWKKERNHVTGLIERPGDDADTHELPRLHVKSTGNLNMVYSKIKDKNGDGYCGMAVTLKEAAHLAMQVPEAKYFTWHQPRNLSILSNEWSRRVFAWSQKRADEAGRGDKRKWIPEAHVTSGTIELKYAPAERLRMSMEPMSGEEEDIFRRLSIGDRNVLHRSRGNSTDSERSRTGIMESDRRPSVSPVPELPMIEDESPNKEGGLPDKEGGLPNMDSNLSLDKREDKRKVTIYRDRNMVYKLIGDINGDGFLGKVDSLQSAADLAAMYPEIRGFVYHSARMPGKYAGRVYGWNEERMLILSRSDPKIWKKSKGHTTGLIEPLDPDAPPVTLPRIQYKAKEGMNMVSYKIKDKNGDGYCGIAVSAREAARLAILVPRAKYYTWFHPEDFFSATEYSGRVYAWTEERAQEAGRADPKKWIPQSSVTSGTMWLLDEEAERLRLNPVESIAHLDANGDSNSTESSTNTPDHVGGETRSSDASDRLLEKQSRDSVSSTDTIELASTLRVSTASESTVEGAVAPEDGVKNSKTAEKGVQDMSGESGAHTTAEVEQCCGRIDDS